MPLEAPLPLAQEQQLRHDLKAVLEQAQLALLREEQVIYDASLDKAAVRVATYFQQDAAAAAFAESLRDLAGETVAQSLPAISASLKALQDYIGLLHSRYPATATDAAGDGEAAP